MWQSAFAGENLIHIFNLVLREVKRRLFYEVTKAIFTRARSNVRSAGKRF